MCLHLVLIIKYLWLYKNSSFLVRIFVLCTKYGFVHKSTNRTILYENSTMFKYLIYNVINIEKQWIARKYKIISCFYVGYFYKKKNNKKYI